MDYVLLASYPAPVFKISTALNLYNTCSSKRVKPIRFLLGHSVYYLWVNKVEAPRKLISQLSLQQFFNSLAQHGSAQFSPVNGRFLNWRESVLRDDLSAFKPPADHCPSDVRTRTVTEDHQHWVANLILFMPNKSEKNVFQSALHSSDTRSSQSSRSGPHTHCFLFMIFALTVNGPANPSGS